MADELVTLTDGTNTVNFLSGQEATTGYVKSNIEGLDPPSLKVTMSGGKPIYSSYDDREITITFGIVATDAADLTTKQTKLITILENTRLHWESKGRRGAKAQLQYRRPGGTNTSYIDVYWGECDWGRVEHQEGAAYAYSLKGAQLTLTCEIAFHPSAVVNLVNASTIYNHDDATAGHDNYVDIAAASIKGDIEAPIKLQVLFKTMADAPALFSILAGRRTRGTVGSFTHIHEAEAFPTQSYWADAGGDSYCSGTEKVTDSSYTSGYLEKTWLLDADNRGEFYCFARLKADDIVNTKFRTRWRDAVVGDFNDGEWTWLKVASEWQWMSLGTVYFDPNSIGTTQPFWRIEYEKDALDLVECDYVMLLPRDESAFYCSLKTQEEIWGVSGTLTIDETADFGPMQVLSVYLETNLYYRPRLMLKPGVLNRLIFAAESYDGSNVIHEVHGISADLQMDITIDYLPQYLTPME